MGSRRSVVAVVALVAIVIIAIIIAFSAMRPSSPQVPQTMTPLDNFTLPARGYFMGILPMPGANQSFESSYAQAATCADFAPVWGRPTPFYSLAADLKGSWGQTFVTGYIRGNGMFPLLQLSFMGENFTLAAPPGMENATLGDPAWRSAYRQAALDVVKAARPLYLSLGNEVNLWYEKQGAGNGTGNAFMNYVSLYEEIYDSVKELSPQTRVFCTFAREVASENREADLGVLGLFNQSKLDLLVFTSYPFAVQGVKRASELPDDYYTRALTNMPGKPIGFTELGWLSLDYFGGEQGQADFLEQVAGRLTRGQGADLQLFGWCWLHDLSDADSAGLISANSTAKAAYTVWQTLYSSH